MIIRLGKATDNEVVADHPHVSRHHARLTRDQEGRLLLEDLGSTNGTFVNDAQVLRKYVVPTDRVRLGDASECLKS